MIAWLLALGLALQEEPRIERAARLDETTLLLETPPAVTVHVVDSDRGRGEVLWSAPGLALVRLPRDAGRVRVISEGRFSDFRPFADARPVTYGETPSNVRLTVLKDGIFVENAGTSSVVVIVRVQEPERRRWKFLGALAVVPGERRAVVLPPGGEAVLVRPGDATGGLYQAPPEPPAAGRDFGGRFGFNDGPLAWRGLGLRAGGFFAPSLHADVPASTHTGLDSLSQPFTVRLEMDQMDFEVFSVGLAADAGLLRVSAHFFAGEWEGRGDLTVDDGLTVTVLEDTRIEGELLGVELSVSWPALTFRGDEVELSLGPDASAAWIRAEVDGAEGSPIELDDTFQEFVVSPGLRASFRIVFSWVDVGVDGGVRYAMGDLRGMLGDVALAIVFRF